MKRTAFVFALLCSLTVYSQKDTLLGGYSLIYGVGMGAGVVIGAPDYEYGYHEVFYDKKVYCDFRAEFGFLSKEKIGVRIVAQRQGNRSDGESYREYSEDAFPGYHYLSEYSNFYSGYTFSSVTPELMYRVGKEPFNCTFSAGFGAGELKPGYGNAILQENGNNNFKEMTYSAEKAWNLTTAIGADVAYMRQLSPHVFMNTGVYASFNTVFVDYSYTCTEQFYNQPISFSQTFEVHHMIWHLNSGLFINFQWNSEESARAFYY